MKKIKELISKQPIVFMAIAVLAGLFLGWFIFGGTQSDNAGGSDNTEITNHEHEAGTTWTCSMHPQIQQDKPGTCPICGMDLIPLADDQADSGFDPNAVVLSSSAAKIAEVQTSVVSKGEAQRTVVLLGKVVADERRINEITAHFTGRIEKLSINYTGQYVRKGQLLATVYSPELVSAQKELFEATKYKDSNPQLYKAARNKFKLWLFTEEQIEKIESSEEVQYSFELLSPGFGTVTKRNIALGDYIKPGQSMFQIIDLSHLWIELNAYETDVPWINKGSEAVISINSVPGKEFKSKVSFIDPMLNNQTRTTVVRTELDNRSGLLKPGMFAQAKIQSNLDKLGLLMIPKSAVLWTGKRSVVYVKEERNNKMAFHYREILLGEDTGSHYVVLDGLEEGESVATNGVFKIDAAAQLKGATSMMNPPEAGAEGEDEMKGDTKEKVTVFKGVDDNFKQQITAVVEVYLVLKDALVLTDGKEAQAAAPIVISAMKNVQMDLLKGEARTKWMEFKKVIDSELDKIANTDDVVTQRKSFSGLSDNIYNSIKAFDIFGLNMYYQYCPMAIGYTGAFWISKDPNIRNPYFGDQMMRCGETREILE